MDVKAIGGLLCLMTGFLASACSTHQLGEQAADPAPVEQGAQEHAWTMIEPGGATACSDGSPYRFYVKPGESDRLFVFLNGGGACWTGETCDSQSERATYVPRADLPHNDPEHHSGVFDLTNPRNPVRDWTMVFVPYCTGDIHLGAATRSYNTSSGTEFDVRHNGAVNASAVFEWLGKNASPQRVIVAGASAGALASPVYAGRVSKLFPHADIVQFSDGASGYQSGAAPTILDHWGVFGALPSAKYRDLAIEEAGFYSFYAIEDKASSRISFGLYDTTEDQVQTMFRSLTGNTAPLSQAIRATYADLDEAVSPVTHYLAPGDAHTILRFDSFYSTAVGDTSFSDWFEDLLLGTPREAIDCQNTSQGCRSQP